MGYEPTTNCDDVDLSDVQFGWTCVVLFGTIAANIPQQYRIARRRSAEGVSAYWLGTGIISATCGLINILILSLDLFDCCPAFGQYKCASALMGVAVNIVQWLVFFVILFLWSIVLPVTKWEYPDKPHNTVSTMIWMNIISFIHLVITFAIFGILYRYGSNDQLTAYANSQGVISAIIAALQYAPQIWLTWKLKHTGSISIPWLIVQTPGGLAAMTALVNRPGTNWTTWLGSLGTFIGQLCLLVLCCCWAWKDRKRRRQEEAELGVERERWTWKNWPRKKAVEVEAPLLLHADPEDRETLE